MFITEFSKVIQLQMSKEVELSDGEVNNDPRPPTRLKCIFHLSLQKKICMRFDNELSLVAQRCGSTSVVRLQQLSAT
jgi:hypothetical protein